MFVLFPPSAKTNTPNSDSTRIEDSLKPAKSDVASSIKCLPVHLLAPVLVTPQRLIQVCLAKLIPAL